MVVLYFQYIVIFVKPLDWTRKVETENDENIKITANIYKRKMLKKPCLCTRYTSYTKIVL